jgi:hypothetical protein
MFPRPLAGGAEEQGELTTLISAASCLDRCPDQPRRGPSLGPVTHTFVIGVLCDNDLALGYDRGLARCGW